MILLRTIHICDAAAFTVLQLTENTTSSIMLVILLLDLIILQVFSNQNCSVMVCFSSNSINKLFAVSPVSLKIIFKLDYKTGGGEIILKRKVVA